MNVLNYIQEGVFAKNQISINNLDHQDTANLLLMSDSHGDRAGLENILLKYSTIVDAVLFSGDGIEDFLYYINLSRYDRVFKNFIPPAMFIVAGNCDATRYLMVQNKTPRLKDESEQIVSFPAFLFLKACNQKIMLTHGHEFFVDFEMQTLSNFARLNKCDIAIYGHTHIPKLTEIDGISLINSGSISRPRGGSQKSFAMLKIKKGYNFKLEFINI